MVVSTTGKKGRWACACDCGGGTEAPSHSLLNYLQRSCGCTRNDLRKHDLTGKRFGRVTVLSRVDLHKRAVTWELICDCGQRFKRNTEALVNVKEPQCPGCRRLGGAKKLVDVMGVKLSVFEIAKIAGLSSGYSVHGRLQAGDTGVRLIRPHRFADRPHLIGKYRNPARSRGRKGRTGKAK